jgi:phosphoesterase RecJ-like protein
MAGDRLNKVNELLRREISLILQSEVNDPRIRNIIIKDIELSRDLKTAKLLCDIGVFETEKAQVLKGLRGAAGFIRKELAGRIKMKFIPRLYFSEAAGQPEKDPNIKQIFAKIENERKAGRSGGAFPYPHGGTSAMDSVISVIRDYPVFLISSHINPEGDSVGSQVALYHILKKLGKKACMVNADPPPNNLYFLKGAEEIKQVLPDELDDFVHFILDCPVPERIGSIKDKAGSPLLTVNIDHHVSNSGFGDINWVDGTYSCVGEMIFELSGALPVEPALEILEPVYSAIVTDTGMFNYSNTSARTHFMTAKLIEKGVRPEYIYKNIFESRRKEEILLLSKVLSSLRLTGQGKVASISLTERMIRDSGGGDIPTDDFINFPRSIASVKIAVFFKQHLKKPGLINVSFRSDGDVDVNRLASSFGGGGHECAAGCRIEGEIENVRDIVLKKVEESLS